MFRQLARQAIDAGHGLEASQLSGRSAASPLRRLVLATAIADSNNDFTAGLPPSPPPGVPAAPPTGVPACTAALLRRRRWASTTSPPACLRRRRLVSSPIRSVG